MPVIEKDVIKWRMGQGEACLIGQAERGLVELRVLERLVGIQIGSGGGGQPQDKTGGGDCKRHGPKMIVQPNVNAAGVMRMPCGSLDAEILEWMRGRIDGGVEIHALTTAVRADLRNNSSAYDINA